MGLKGFDDLDVSNAKVLRTRILDPGSAASQPGWETVPGRHEICIPGWRPALKNELKKGGHWGFARLKKRDRIAVAEAALIRRIPKAIRKRRVSVEVTRSGRMKEVDQDAIQWSLLDALVAAGLLVDDSPRWVELGPVTQIRGAVKATKITLEDIEDV